MSKSSQLTSVFWFAYGASRIVGIVGSKYLIPRTYILLAMTGSSTQKLRIRLSFYLSWWNWKWFAFHRVSHCCRSTNWVHNCNILS